MDGSRAGQISAALKNVALHQEIVRGRAVMRERHRDPAGIADGLPRKLPARQRQRRVAHRAMNPAAASRVVVVKYAMALI